MIKKEVVNRCAFCRKPISAGYLMCFPHWCGVPYAQQQAVNRTWRAFQKAVGPQARLHALSTYHKARDAAIASLAPPTPIEGLAAGETRQPQPEPEQ